MAFKTQQEALTVEEQIKNLKIINLTISDEASAKQFLNDVSYFRFIKAYSHTGRVALPHENIHAKSILAKYSLLHLVYP